MKYMDDCNSYRDLDPAEYNIDEDRVRTIGVNWGVTVTKEGKVRVPVCSYDDVLPLIRKRSNK